MPVVLVVASRGASNGGGGGGGGESFYDRNADLMCTNAMNFFE